MLEGFETRSPDCSGCKVSGLQHGATTPSTIENGVAQCNPLTLQPEQSGGAGSILSRASPLERHDITDSISA